MSLAAAGHLLWEATQLPLYTIWWTGTRGEILFAVIRCTAGDAALVLAILTARLLRWPLFGGRMMLAAILLGLGYTVFSARLNVGIRQSWSYTEAMPLAATRHRSRALSAMADRAPSLAFVLTASRGHRAHRLMR